MIHRNQVVVAYFGEAPTWTQLNAVDIRSVAESKQMIAVLFVIDFA